MKLHFSDELDQQLFIELLFVFILMSIANIIGNVMIAYDFAINYKWFAALVFGGLALNDCLRGQRFEFWKLLIFSLATFILIPSAFLVFGGLNILLIPYIICTSVVVSFLTYGKQRLFMVGSLFLVSIGLFTFQVVDQQIVQMNIQPLVRPDEILRDMPLQLFITMGFCTYIAVRFSNVWRQEHQTIKEYSQQLKHQNNQLEWMATHDELTGVFNRRYLVSNYFKLKELSNAHLLLLDIDDFKYVNDSYGHKTGDKLLIEAAKLFLKTIGDKGKVCRLGGDEFVLLLFNSSRHEIKAILQTLRDEFSRLSVVDAHTTTLSGGIIKLDPTKSLSDNLIHADQLLYTAKNKGKKNIESYTEYTS